MYLLSPSFFIGHNNNIIINNDNNNDNNNNNYNNNNNGDVQASQISEVVWILHRETPSRSWNIRIVTETKQGCESSEIIHFKKGLPQGDFLCPTLFILCLNPIAWKLRATSSYKL